ncbi:MAG: YicC family protein [Eubacteriales bacterium]|nr:YicC family protein [Eubacteriales bacterium]
MESMTGYGRGSARRDGREITVELKTVNHRYLDVSFRAPKSVAFLEDPLRARIQQGGVQRGHIDLYVNYENHREDARSIDVDEGALKAFHHALHGVNKLLEDYRRPTVAEALSLSGALSVRQQEDDGEVILELALEAVDQAVTALLEMRRREGDALQQDLLANLTILSDIRQQIALRAPQVPEDYRQRLNARLAEWKVSEVEPQRLAQEVALMADRCAIDEELSRLDSHIAQFRDTVQNGRETGKKLDFLLQEMNRETNTIGSKASDAAIAQQVVEAKCVIEKLREQVQNAV